MTDNIYNSELVSKPEINEDELFVRVENNWRSKQKYLKEFGYDEEDY